MGDHGQPDSYGRDFSSTFQRQGVTAAILKAVTTVSECQTRKPVFMMPAIYETMPF